jgi:hypothetical protein
MLRTLTVNIVICITIGTCTWRYIDAKNARAHVVVVVVVVVVVDIYVDIRVNIDVNS